MYFGINQMVALLVGTSGYMMDWFGMLLLSDSDPGRTVPRPSRDQMLAIWFAFGLGLFAWLRVTLVVQGDAAALRMNRATTSGAAAGLDFGPSLATFVFGDAAGAYNRRVQSLASL